MMINIKDKPMAIVAPVPAVSPLHQQQQQHTEVMTGTSSSMIGLGNNKIQFENVLMEANKSSP